ncbi:hypothetical protein SVAN01_06996 [Stagonosporopsis vannaccii]|nr:hypothetical protein SVAN01_06996 [Stagonosporopsis vannaccii]
MHCSASITPICTNVWPLRFLQLFSFFIPSILGRSSAPLVSLLLATVPLSVRSASAHRCGNLCSMRPTGCPICAAPVVLKPP